MFLAMPLLIFISSIDPNNFTIEHCVQFDESDAPHCMLEVVRGGHTKIHGVQTELDALDARGAHGVLSAFPVLGVNEEEYFKERSQALGLYLFEVTGATGTVSAAAFPAGLDPFVRVAPLDGSLMPSKPGSELLDGPRPIDVLTNSADLQKDIRAVPGHDPMRGNAQLMSPDGDTVQCIVGSVSAMITGALVGASAGASQGTNPQEKMFWTALGAVSGGVAGFMTGMKDQCTEAPKAEVVKDTTTPPTDAAPVDPPLEPIPTDDTDKTTPVPDAVATNQPAPIDPPKGESSASDASTQRPIAIQPEQAIVLPRELSNTMRAMNSVRGMRGRW